MNQPATNAPGSLVPADLIPTHTDASRPHSDAFLAQKINPGPFWTHNPEGWFVGLEINFEVLNITDDKLKFATLWRSLSRDVALRIDSTIRNLPLEGRYEVVKQALLKEFSDTIEQRLDKLFERSALGSKKPSDLLKEMYIHAGPNIDKDGVRSYWRKLLPKDVQFAIASLTDLPDDKLFELADRIHHIHNSVPDQRLNAVETDRSISSVDLQDLNKRLASLEKSLRESRNSSRSNNNSNRSRSKSRNTKSRKSASGLCFAHSKYPDNPTSCRNWCSKNAEWKAKNQ
ncbi:uncharacterized protein LOC107981416 [Nasonia vitripennis]|uniref:DUF7041 domain-containing protein n=1 Tax=Nasonia vitripennis TaxID=7425 RepID=A0A7M7IS33_NASVI|nr:uncharacterized protein LOC107981416 [Nasonia vitripennis]